MGIEQGNDINLIINVSYKSIFCLKTDYQILLRPFSSMIIMLI